MFPLGLAKRVFCSRENSHWRCIQIEPPVKSATAPTAHHTSEASAAPPSRAYSDGATMGPMLAAHHDVTGRLAR